MEINDLEPKALWSIFAKICEIPHPSHREEALARWIVERAASAGLEAERDGAGNVILRREASPGLEKTEGIVLQAHLDMVPQANAAARHDFAVDPIRPRFDPEEPGWLKAVGTTLGADNGLGVAAALAILESKDLRHGPLEALFTLSEEDGMDGARGLAKGAVRGSLLVNLDNEEEEDICLGCAGSNRLVARFSEAAEPPPAGYRWARIAVAGLHGGHSGGDIHLGRGNAPRILARILLAAEGGAGTGGAPLGPVLGSFSGGSLANAIPREAEALVGLRAEDYEVWSARAEAAAESERSALGSADPGLELSLSPAERPETCLGAEAARRVLGAITAIPDGLRSMSERVAGVPALSSNLGVVATELEGNRLRITLKDLVRAEDDAERETLLAEIEAAFAGAGASTEQVPGILAWTPNPDSPLLARAVRAYRSAYGKEPRLAATHGGLECALFRVSNPGWDMIAIGPTIKHAHSPDEKVDIASVGRFWRFLKALVEVDSE